MNILDWVLDAIDSNEPLGTGLEVTQVLSVWFE